MCSNLLSQFLLGEHYIICSISAVPSLMPACVYSSFLMRVYLRDGFVEFIHLAVAKLFSRNAKTVLSPIGSVWEGILYVLPPHNMTSGVIKSLFIRSSQTYCLTWKLGEYFTTEIFRKRCGLLCWHTPYTGSELSWSHLDHTRASLNCCCEDWWYKATNNKGS